MINKYRHPSREEWPSILERSAPREEPLSEPVGESLAALRSGWEERVGPLLLFGDARLPVEVSPEEFDEAETLVPQEVKEALLFLRRSLEKFYRSRRSAPEAAQPAEGMDVRWKTTPIARIGIVAGPTAFASTLLTIGAPARVAGCEKIIVAAPADPVTGAIDPELLVAARSLGVDSFLRLPPVEAMAAMAYGLGPSPRLFKLFVDASDSPKSLAAAKALAFEGIDVETGGAFTELAIIADDTASPLMIAADVLALAEQGDGQALIVSTSERVLDEAMREVTAQLSGFARPELLKRALGASRAVLVKELGEAVSLVDEFAPQQLLILTSHAGDVAETIGNAGAVYVGSLTTTGVGPSVTGSGRFLPPLGAARSRSGIGLESFRKSIEIHSTAPEGMKRVGRALETLARAEGLEGCKEAVSTRLKTLGFD